MVFSHLPANFLLMAVPFAPDAEIAVGLLVLRSLLTQMDVPARQSYVMATVTAAERPAEIPPPPVPPPGWGYEELRRFQAPVARQAVVADRDFLYVISNHTLGKYRKATGERVAVWEGGENGEVIHLNAGLFFEGRLYCVHSNYPGVPMLSSVEIFDPVTLKHVGSHSFGRMDGSFTWLDRAPAKMAGTTAARSSGLTPWPATSGACRPTRRTLRVTCTSRPRSTSRRMVSPSCTPTTRAR
jgi:hypothetical protein